MKLLITTFNNWQILPELVGFVAPVDYPLYDSQYDDNVNVLSQIERSRKQYNIVKPDEMWMICTDGVESSHYEKWFQWHEKFPAIPYRIFRLKGLNDIKNLADSRKMREMILRVILLARMNSGIGDSLFMSLAGGRKTMSSDMQYAAGFFGCDGLIHISASNIIRVDDERIFFDTTKKFSGFDALPFITDRFDSHPGLRLLDTAGCSINLSNINTIENICIENNNLLEQIEKLYQSSGNFYSNYNNLENDLNKSNFTVLFTLPKSRYDLLNNFRILSRQNFNDIAEIIRALPKTDLHCHLGGVLFPEEICTVAECYRQDVALYKKQSTLFSDFLESCSDAAKKNSLKILPDDLLVHGIKDYYYKHLSIENIPRHVVSSGCALCLIDNPQLFKKLIYGKLLDDGFDNIGIEKYEKLGDFQGSSLLQSKESIEKTIDILCTKYIADNVKYFELRCSPHKYVDGGLDEISVYNIIEDRLRYHSKIIKSKIIIIASRHGDDYDIKKAVNLIMEIVSNRKFHLLAGIDLAGNEAARSPEDVRNMFLPVLEKCINVTIHAGETMQADSIWEAVYHLSAERIGHGLTLINYPELLKKVADRRIGIELCPSSNIQIVGYPKPRDTSVDADIYPVKKYLENDLRVSINTDNPGISLTDCSREIYKAAAYSKDGLNMFEILQLIKNGVLSSFQSHAEKKMMIYDFENFINSLKDDVWDWMK